ncbi:la-related protein 6-like [Spinachia spinachia]
MTNPIGDCAQSARVEEGREGTLLCMKIKAKLEVLLSDSHLAEDGFLLKHVQKNRQGYVSLKLLTCSKKIKVLTTNWCVTRAAAEDSELLAVNEERTKVRRIEPLPRWLLCSPTSKILLAWNICGRKTAEEDGAPEGQGQARLSESILQKFSPHGSVTSLWVLYPGKKLPKELQCYAKRHKELGQHLCAVVKFDHLDEVRKAYKALGAVEKQGNGEGMSVVPLGFQGMRHLTSDEPSGVNTEDKPQHTPSQENPLHASENPAQEEPPAPLKVSDTRPPQKSSLISTSRNRGSFPGWIHRFNMRSWWSGDSNDRNSQSPWVQSRRFPASVLNPRVAESSDAPNVTQRVVRQPRGPGRSEGFHTRGKLLPHPTLPGKQLPLC